MSEQLVTEYDFSSGSQCTRDVNVENWWLVRLTEANVLGLDWSSQLTVSKLDLYNQYARECVGTPRGMVYFWGNLTRLVPFVEESSSWVTLPSLQVAQGYSHNLNLDERWQGFAPSHSLSQ